MTIQHSYLKRHCQGTGFTATFARNLGYVPIWALPPLARHCMKSFGQYSIMLCARAGSNTEFLYIGFRFLHLLSASAFLAEAAMHKYTSVAGSGHGCGSSVIQRRKVLCQNVRNVPVTANLLHHDYTLIDLVLRPQRPGLQTFDLPQALPSCDPLRRGRIGG